MEEKVLKGPAIAPITVSAPFNCGVSKEQKITITNTFSSGFNFSPDNPEVLFDNSVHLRDGYITCAELNDILLSSDEVLSETAKNKCFVYPNPLFSEEKLFLNCNKVDSVVIYDTVGNVIKTSKNINKTYVTMNELSAGTYIVIMYFKGEIISRNKIILK